MLEFLKCDSHLRYTFANKYEFKRVKEEAVIENTSEVYKPISSENDENFFRNDWTVLGFRAFKQLQKIVPKRCAMCIVGTGGGLDALGAIEILNPESLLVTDLSNEALNQSHKNILNNLKHKQIELSQRRSFLYNEFKTTDGKFDFMYENLPNLPLTKLNKIVKSDQPVTASYYFKKEILDTVPVRISDNLLTLHWLFLKSANNFLKKGGKVLCSIGGRINFSEVERMFIESGFEPELIIYDFKKQNEAASNLPGYALEEKRRKSHSIYRYYNYDDMLKRIGGLKYDKLSGFANNKESLKAILKEHELSAQQAFKIYKEKGTQMGHEVYFVLGKMKRK